MFPTFSGQGDLVVVDATSRWLGKISTGESLYLDSRETQETTVRCPGDVVICIRPVEPKENVIKRITAVENEHVVLYPDRDHPDVRRVQVIFLFDVRDYLSSVLDCSSLAGSRRTCVDRRR